MKRLESCAKALRNKLVKLGYRVYVDIKLDRILVIIDHKGNNTIDPIFKVITLMVPSIPSPIGEIVVRYQKRAIQVRKQVAAILSLPVELLCETRYL